MKYHEQLKTIMRASGWSQEQLAHKLNVSFATLNSWINVRSKPRTKALHAIDKLYLDIVGVDIVDADVLLAAKQATLNLRITPKKILNDKEYLDKLALYLTYHTNNIEGSTMTLLDVEEVIFDQKVLNNRTAIEQSEARNHQAALYWLLDEMVNQASDFVIDEKLLLNIHLRLMNGIISDAGQYRKHAVRIMGTQVVLANWAKVPDLVKELTNDLVEPTDDIIKMLATTHAKFEKIHPFSDGNGRVGRLIMLAQALKFGLIPPLIIKERKYAYYKYLELSQSKNDYESLELFITESISFTNNLLRSN